MTARHLAIVVAVSAAAWIAGFVWFLHLSISQPPVPARADGIVALTGGAERVATALRLLHEGRGHLLLISGVGPGASLVTLARDSGVGTAGEEADITLGRQATSTIGNAAETARWAKHNQLHSLIVVTAFYHMPRALIELGRNLPAATLYAAPVMPGTLWQRPASTLRLLVGEYAKYLFSAAGLSRLGQASGAA